jgi:hypothetical protein
VKEPSSRDPVPLSEAFDPVLLPPSPPHSATQANTPTQKPGSNISEPATTTRQPGNSSRGIRSKRSPASRTPTLGTVRPMPPTHRACCALLVTASDSTRWPGSTRSSTSGGAPVSGSATQSRTGSPPGLPAPFPRTRSISSLEARRLVWLGRLGLASSRMVLWDSLEEMRPPRLRSPPASIRRRGLKCLGREKVLGSIGGTPTEGSGGGMPPILGTPLAIGITTRGTPGIRRGRTPIRPSER